MRVRVRYFAGAAEAAGAREADLELEAGATVAALREVLAARHPRLAGMPFALAVNRAYATDDTPLSEGAEVAVIPPVSGGGAEVPTGPGEPGRSPEPGPPFAPAAWMRIGPEPLDEAAQLGRVRHTAAGAICLFVGTAREYTAGRRTVYLEYEAYRPMADEVLAGLVAQAQERWGPLRVAVEHRTGPVALGEASVIVAVGAAHRAAAFDACRFLIERLKADAPIWKREVEQEGGRWVHSGLAPGYPRKPGYPR